MPKIRISGKTKDIDQESYDKLKELVGERKESESITVDFQKGKILLTISIRASGDLTESLKKSLLVNRTPLPKKMGSGKIVARKNGYELRAQKQPEMVGYLQNYGVERAWTGIQALLSKIKNNKISNHTIDGWTIVFEKDS